MTTDTEHSESATFGGILFTKGKQGEVIGHYALSSSERYRRTSSSKCDYEFFVKSNCTWYPTSERPNVVQALNYFWPLSTSKPEPFGKRGWVPAGNGCVRATKCRTIYARFRRHETHVEGQNRTSKQWTVCGHGPIPVEALKALDHYWPPEQYDMKDKPSDPIEWTFVAMPDKVDIGRCLREMYAAGAREVVIDTAGKRKVYFHRSVWDLLHKAGQLADCQWGTPYPDWADFSAPCEGKLAKARAWEDEQKAKAARIRVTVKGTR